jgi:hypothetical protein
MRARTNSPSTKAELLHYSENRVLCHLGDSEFERGFGRNPDLLLRLGIKTRARFSLLIHRLAKARQNEFVPPLLHPALPSPILRLERSRIWRVAADLHDYH